MKNLYVVSLELYHDPGETREFNAEDELRKIGAVKVVQSVWLVAPEGTVSDLAQLVGQFLLKDDRLFVVQINGQPIYKNLRATFPEIDALFRS